MSNGPYNLVLHPTDFSEGSYSAFCHALRITLEFHTGVMVLHVDGHPSRVPWSSFPSFRDALEKWEMIPKNSDRSAVTDLDIDVEKIILKDRDPVHGILETLEGENADLVVLSTHQHRGLAGFLHHSVARDVSLKTEADTLFIPEGQAGFVDPESGQLKLNTILSPVTDAPSPLPGVFAARRLGTALGCQSHTLLHVGGDDTMPDIPEPTGDNTALAENVIQREGDTVSQILKTAEEIDADLICLTTEGRHGFLDAFRGSTTEQVLDGAKCPVLAVHSYEY